MVLGLTLSTTLQLHSSALPVFTVILYTLSHRILLLRGAQTGGRGGESVVERRLVTVGVETAGHG